MQTIPKGTNDPCKTLSIVMNQEIELQFHDWVHGQRNHGLFVSTCSIITKVLQINIEFKGGYLNEMYACFKKYYVKLHT